MVYGASTWTETWHTPQIFVKKVAKDFKKTLPGTIDCGMAVSAVMLTFSFFSPTGNRHGLVHTIADSVTIGVACAGALAVWDITGIVRKRVFEALNS